MGRTDVLLRGGAGTAATVTAGVVPAVVAVGVPSVSTSFADGRDVTTENVGYAPTGVSLTTYTGPMEITIDNTVIDSKQIDGNLTINADNVTVKRCLIVAGPGGEGRDSGLVFEVGTSGTVIEDTELRSVAGTGDDGETAAQDRAICYFADGATIRRCYIHGCRRFIAYYGDGLTIEDTFIGDNVNTSGNHCTVIGAWGEVSYLTVRRCRLRGPMAENSSGTIQAYPQSGPNHHWLIEKCHISGDGGTLMMFGYTPPGESPNYAMTLQDNWFGDATYTSMGVSWDRVAVPRTSAWAEPDGSNVWENNRNFLTDAVIEHP